MALRDGYDRTDFPERVSIGSPKPDDVLAMCPRLRVNPRRTLLRRFLAVVVAVFALSGGYSASTAVAGSIGHAGHKCKCESVCTGKCCCVKKEAQREPSAPLTPKHSSQHEQGPCVGAAPCGGDAIPPASGTAGVSSLKAALKAGMAIRHSTTASLHFSAPDASYPSPTSPPLGEPPESLD
jgi:hypothetical protein